MELFCFGSFRLCLDGETLSLGNKKARELLALLACEKGGPISKRRAGALLWDTETEQAMDSLSKVCGAIRAFSKEHGNCIPLHSSYGELCLDMSEIQCDLVTFDQLYERADAESCRQAAALRTGALFFSDCFEWSEEYSGRYEIRYLELCERLAAHYRAKNEPRLAACYEKLLKIE